MKKLDEDIPVNNASSGAIAGLPPDTPPVGKGITTKGHMLRRKQLSTSKFAGKKVFIVPPNTYYKAMLGKRKYEHYEKYINECEGGEEIREFGRKHWDEPIILQNEKTGAMVYLKYGRK